jgi:hypothetical protein
MPGSILTEWVLQPLFELLLQVFGYWTGRIVVPVLSFGLVRIEHVDSARRTRPRWHGFHRGKHGGIVIDDDMTMFLGFLFWVAVGAAAYFVLR